LDETAENAGCRAYPTVHEVAANTEVIFTAVPVDGYQFVNWTRGSEVLSEDAEAVIEITPLTGDEVIATITANFTTI
jgi:3-hydroxyisobutyrate dehydrogenase-like beta-hydroxyacid dehydrogenase